MDKNDEKDGKPIRDSKKSEHNSAKDGTHRKDSVAGKRRKIVAEPTRKMALKASQRGAVSTHAQVWAMCAPWECL